MLDAYINSRENRERDKIRGKLTSKNFFFFVLLLFLVRIG